MDTAYANTKGPFLHSVGLLRFSAGPNTGFAWILMNCAIDSLPPANTNMSVWSCGEKTIAAEKQEDTSDCQRGVAIAKAVFQVQGEN